MTTQTTFAFIDPAALTTDLRVQRPLDQIRVAELANKFNKDRLGTVVVSQRPNGQRIVLDGQTRRAAAIVAGYKGHIHAQIYTGLTLQQEASMFLDYNNSKAVSALDKFLVRVTEGDPVAVDINRIVNAHGWRVANGGADNTVQSVAALERAYLKAGANGASHLESVISTITSAWGHGFAAMNAGLIGGVSELFLRYGADVDRPKMLREMQSTTPRTLLGRARSMKENRIVTDALPVIVGRVLHTLHNAKMRKNVLPEWK